MDLLKTTRSAVKDVFQGAAWNKDIKKKPGDDGSNILTKEVRIPEWWSKSGLKDEEKQTKTNLTL